MYFIKVSRLDNSYFFGKKLTIIDKHIYHVLHLLTGSCACITLPRILEVAGNDIDEASFHSAIAKLVKFKLIKKEERDSGVEGQKHVIITGPKDKVEIDEDEVTTAKFFDRGDEGRSIVAQYLEESGKVLIRRGTKKAYKDVFIKHGWPNISKQLPLYERGCLQYFHGHFGEKTPTKELLQELDGLGVLETARAYIAKKSGTFINEEPLETIKKLKKDKRIARGINLFYASVIYFVRKNSAKIFEKVVKEKEYKPKMKEIPAVVTPQRSSRVKTHQNPKLNPEFVGIVDHWNNQQLRKHGNMNSKTITDAEKLYFKGKKENKFSKDIVLQAIEFFNAKANDPNVRPLGRAKERLKKVSLDKFFYDSYNGYSELEIILTEGATPKVTPYSEDILNRTCAFIERFGFSIKPGDVSVVSTFINRVKEFLDQNKKKFITAPNTPVILGSLISKVVEGAGERFHVKFLLGDRIIDKYLPKILIDDGHVAVISKSEEVTYSIVKPVEKPKPTRNYAKEDSDRFSSKMSETDEEDFRREIAKMRKRAKEELKRES